MTRKDNTDTDRCLVDWVLGKGSPPETYSKEGVATLSREAMAGSSTIDVFGPRVLEYLARALCDEGIGTVSRDDHGWWINGPGGKLHLNRILMDICTSDGTLQDVYDYIVMETERPRLPTTRFVHPVRAFRPTAFPTSWPEHVALYPGQLVSQEQFDTVLSAYRSLLEHEDHPDRVLFRIAGVDVTPTRFVEVLERADNTARVNATILWNMLEKAGEED